MIIKKPEETNAFRDVYGKLHSTYNSAEDVNVDNAINVCVSSAVLEVGLGDMEITSKDFRKFLDHFIEQYPEAVREIKGRIE